MADNTTYLSIAEWHGLQAAVVITSTLSMLGCISIFFSYIAWADIRTTSRTLLVYLSVCDFITALFNTVGVMADLDQLEDITEAPTALCVAQAFFNTYSSIASFLWTTSIALYLFLTIVMRSSTRAEQSVLFMHLVCWGCPAVAVGAAAGMGKLGYDMTITPGWCWLRPNPGNLWILLAGKGWELASYIITPVLYIFIKRAITQDGQPTKERTLLLTQRARDAGVEADRKLAFVPLVYLLLRIWGTVRSLMDLAGCSTQNYGLLLMQAIGDCGQGCANAILFCGFTRRVRDRFVGLCKRERSHVAINDVLRASPQVSRRL